MAALEADNPARPAAGLRLCAVADLADPGARGFRFRAGDRLFAGFVVRGQFANGPVQTAAVGPAMTETETLRTVVSSASEMRPILQQFVFENASAHRVSVVGDFNKWNAAAAPMQRSAGDATWSVIIPVVPGRHVYGFMVDDSVFTLDPRAAKVKDADLGTEGSVVIVGRP